MSPPPPAVVVTGLVKRYGARPVVAGLDLVAPREAVTAVLGPNGAGKTTTIEICEGYRRPDEGEVKVLGLDPWRDAAQLRPRVGVMLQTGGVYGSVNPQAALTHAAALYANPQQPQALIDLLGLAECATTPVKRLSGGQQQRLGIALAIIGRPELVFLDEPTAGLDPQSRHATWELIVNLRSAGVAVVLTTHYIEEAQQLADHVVILDRGEVVAAGSSTSLISAAGSDAVRFGATAGLDLAGLQRVLPAGAVVIEVSPGAYRATGGAASELLTAVNRWCTARGVQPTSMTTEQRTLQDVFLDLTGRELLP